MHTSPSPEKHSPLPFVQNALDYFLSTLSAEDGTDLSYREMVDELESMREMIRLGAHYPQTKDESVAVILKMVYWVNATNQWRLLESLFQYLLDELGIELPLEDQINILNRRGQAVLNQGQPQDALNHHNLAFNLAQEASNLNLIGECCFHLALAHRDIFEYEKALDFGRRGLAAFGEDDGPLRWLSSLHFVVGDVYYRLNEIENSLTYLQKARIGNRQAGDSQELLRTLLRMCWVYGNENRFEEARLCVEEALSIKSKNKIEQARCSIFHGWILRKLGEFDKAEIAFKEADIIELKQPENSDTLADLFWETGCLWVDRGEAEQAIPYFHQTINLYQSKKINFYDEILVRWELGQVYFKKGDFIKAVDEFDFIESHIEAKVLDFSWVDSMRTLRKKAQTFLQSET